MYSFHPPPHSCYRIQLETIQLVLISQEPNSYKTFSHISFFVSETTFPKLYEWVDAKINESKARVERDIRMDIARRQDLKDRAAERQKRMEASRRNIREQYYTMIVIRLAVATKI